MKTIAFLYNVRHHYPEANDYKNQLQGDFDDPITIRWQIKHLKNLGFNVIPIEANEEAYLKLYRLKKKINLVFNIAEGLHGKDRELQIPAMLEMLQIPYTGSSPLTHAFSLNKEKAKEVFIANGIPTPIYQVFQTYKDSLSGNLKFPLIVKPIAEGSSMGITNKSVVYDEDSLRRQVKKIITTFNEPAIVELFLEGREFSVSMLGNPPQILPIIESDHKMLPKKYQSIDSLEVKWYFEDKNLDYLICPAKIDIKLQKKLEKISYKIWQALEVLDWGRIDIRCDRKDNPFVLEINSPPGFAPPEASLSSYFPLAGRAAGLDYEKVMLGIIQSAAKRYGLKI
ncbi:MAG: D-alanine-D-alanine ligase [Candidatus Roizmanbacteria bacterium GW2011_GWC2_37_13]|uniref:D-alanine-D-alanine ligase n=1 Tax=Candidatus Roizmanbacteria bacterium GW2011_GWC2_37_13 TaxID=1618486 RepID=A0A0G0GDN5_9BACT|nr:MAG: D-alanine-D-alanine ligase [Candidatus Roizmanbacteria bacterium GW2011_GWC1_37_12]KKQ24150.1 MAG: D-alanine-D-alanine ligase [Candidatus Roizmanbacteria bacterium GW2011_GWC2_37_13]